MHASGVVQGQLWYSSGVQRFLLLLGVLSLAGCKGCKNDHPYVPYAIDDDAGDAEALASADAGEDGGEPSREISSTQAPANASRWTLDGLSLVAPAGMVFELGVAR